MELMRRVFSALAFWLAPFAFVAALAATGVVHAAGEKCLECHGDAEDVTPIGKTKHRTSADSRAPTCMSCHGTSEKHIEASGGEKPDRTFNRNPQTPVEERNGACLGCHQKDGNRTHWSGSTHETRGLACASCHQIHTGQDRVRDKRRQTEVCFGCHKDKRTEVNKPSHHPVLEGKVVCSDCHNVHGSVGPKLMKRDSVNETCYTCHMEKRGPFVHNHEPVSDDCTNCHNPHGTVAENMLKMRAPFLCQQCHTPHAAIEPMLGGSGVSPKVPGWNGVNITQGRACLNCHTQIHGSNNPSLAPPTPQFLYR